MVGTFVFFATDSNTIKGQALADPRYPEPIVRMDISKSDLMGDYYLHIANYKYKLGEVKIKKVQEN